jgi:hypothetical protein
MGAKLINRQTWGQILSTTDMGANLSKHGGQK